jgi:hypothetical protein
MNPHAIFGWAGHWPWVALFLLGAFHGVNPAMGWLFAVSLGLQRKSWMAVLQAVPPILLGHAASMVLIVALLEALKAALPPMGLRVACALILLAFGASRLWRSRHPRWVGMQVGFLDLTAWSFLMASAHGAGLMLAPFVFILQGGVASHAMNHAAMTGMHPGLASLTPLTPLAAWLLPVGIHTLGYVVLLVLIAVTVYSSVGVAILRRAWINLDVFWAAAVMLTGMLTLFL